MSNEMTCEECLVWVHAYLDHELDAQTAAKVERHLHDCAGCRGMLAGPEALRDCLRERLPYHTLPVEVRQQILLRARANGCRRAPGRLRGWLGWAALALAAAMLLLAALLYHATPAPRESLTDELVSSHVRSLQEQHLTDVTSADPQRVGQWLAGKIDFVPPVFDFAREGFALVGGRLDYVGHRPVAALVYRHGGHIVNLFVMPTLEADDGLHAGSQRGFHLVSWQRDRLAFEAVSDLGADQIQALARLIEKEGRPAPK
jgi:anti-sigma factor RsiW